MNRNPLKCSMCFFTTLSHRHLVYHNVRVHRHDPRFFVKCNVPGCGATYTKWWSYKKHVQRNHRDQDDILNDFGNDLNNFPDEEIHLAEYGHENRNNAPILQKEESLQWHAAKFYLSIRDVCRTSHEAAEKIMEGVVHLFREYSSTILLELNELANDETNSVALDRIKEVFERRL